MNILTWIEPTMQSLITVVILNPKWEQCILCNYWLLKKTTSYKNPCIHILVTRIAYDFQVKHSYIQSIYHLPSCRYIHHNRYRYKNTRNAYLLIKCRNTECLAYFQIKHTTLAFFSCHSISSSVSPLMARGLQKYIMRIQILLLIK